MEEEIGIDHTWCGHVFGTNSAMQHGIDGVDGSSKPEYHGVHLEESTDKSFWLKSGRYLRLSLLFHLLLSFPISHILLILVLVLPLHCLRIIFLMYFHR